MVRKQYRQLFLSGRLLCQGGLLRGSGAGFSAWLRQVDGFLCILTLTPHIAKHKHKECCTGSYSTKDEEKVEEEASLI